MSQEGLIFSDLSDFKQDLLKDIATNYPKAIKKFIKQEARKCSKVAKKIAKREVGTNKGKKKDWVDTKSYHKRFDSSSVFNFSSGEYGCKAFNNARHAKIIEYGHVNVPRGEGKKNHSKKDRRSGKGGQGHGFVAGKFIFKKAELEFKSQFEKDTEDFIGEYFDETVSGKRHSS